MKFVFFIYDWNNDVTSQYLEGTRTFLEAHPDIEINVVEGFGLYGAQNAGPEAFQIFNVPQISTYDGVIIQGNRVWNSARKQIIANRARLYHIPCISLNYPLEGCTYVGTDNYHSLKAMTAHVIAHHGVSRIAFVRGLKTSDEAKEREKAFLDTCEELGVREENIHTYDGSWDKEAGERAALAMIDSGRIPEAVICANDDEAVGVCRIFQEHGIRIPGDVIVTGFDNLDIAEATNPRITTIDRDYAGIARLGLETLLRQVLGEKPVPCVYAPCRPIYSTSCGCSREIDDLMHLQNKYIQMSDNSKLYYKMRDSMGAGMSKADSLRDVYQVFEDQMGTLHCGDCFLILNGDYLDRYENAESVRHFGKRMLLTGMYLEKDEKPEPNDAHIYREFAKEEFFPQDLRSRHRLLVMYPLRSDEICIGYVIVTRPAPIMHFYFMEIILKYVEDAIESVRQKDLLKKLNNHLNDLYMTDHLTGLYNRFGLNNYGVKYYQGLVHEGRTAYFTFIDIDNMKSINDHFGHEAGDEAIRMSGELIRTVTEISDAFGMRYGGDEFLIISEISVLETLKQRIALMHSQHPTDYPLDYSSGEFLAEADRSLSLQEAIDAADDLMYEVKKDKKIQRGLLPDFTAVDKS